MSEHMEKLERAAGGGDAEAAAIAVKSLLGEPYDASQLAIAAEQAQAMVERFRKANDNAKLAPSLLMNAELRNAQDSAREALQDAEEAQKLFRNLGQGRGLASALEAAFQAHLLQMNQAAGLKAINQEVESLHQAGNKQAEVAVLETLAHAHSMLGEPYSAISSYERALAVYRALGDKEGQGTTLHSLAEMYRATDGHAEHAKALDAARQSADAFRAAKCGWGEEKANGTMSSLMAQSGRLEKAPNRQEALKALKEFTRAVEQKNVETAQAAEKKLTSMRDLVTDAEIIEHLQPIVFKDATTSEFLQSELGWSMNEGSSEAVSTGDKLNGSYIKQYSHHAFYLSTAMSGMGFGPQFRSVHPYRFGRTADEIMPVVVAQLPETEAWQMELGYRPGYMDANLQVNGVLGFP